MNGIPEPKDSLIGIVDDDAGVRDSISSLIRSQGFRVAVFSCAEELLASEELKHAACLILDVRMPGASGLELQARLVQMRWRIPVIFATGYAEDKAHREALGRGALAFLYKPFGDEALFAAMRGAFGHFKTEQS